MIRRFLRALVARFKRRAPVHPAPPAVGFQVGSRVGARLAPKKEG